MKRKKPPAEKAKHGLQKRYVYLQLILAKNILIRDRLYLQERERKRERERDQNMVLNLLRYHHRDK